MRLKILVTGGAGYIGSHAVRELLDQSHHVVVLDDLSHGHRAAVDPRATFVKGSTGDESLVMDVLKRYAIDGLMHFAANIEVSESVADPYKYYVNNFGNSLSLLNCMRQSGVKKIVFSSTAAVYGNPSEIPIEESAPRQPINPYGRSKMMMEMAIEDFALAYGMAFTILRYFNVAGAWPDGSLGESHQPESHLIPRVLMAARDHESVRIFGANYNTRDGTCIRDYVHVVDLVRAHVLAMEQMIDSSTAVFNIGSEQGFSVREVIAACEKVVNKKVNVLVEPRRPGDPDILVASSRRISTELHWRRRYPDLETIIAHAWQWHSRETQFNENADLETR